MLRFMAMDVIDNSFIRRILLGREDVPPYDDAPCLYHIEFDVKNNLERLPIPCPCGQVKKSNQLLYMHRDSSDAQMIIDQLSMIEEAPGVWINHSAPTPREDRLRALSAYTFRSTYLYFEDGWELVPENVDDVRRNLGIPVPTLQKSSVA